MMVNLMIVLFSAAIFVYANGSGVAPDFNYLDQAEANLKEELNEKVLDIMKMHFDHSLDYLYTGVQYDSQYGERPGLAKKLRGMSDDEWEAGMSALNKFLEHGGSTNLKFVNKFQFGGGETAKTGISSKGQTYAFTLKKLAEDSLEKQSTYNKAWKLAFNNDADIAHYLEEKIEKEVKHSHELNGQITTFEAMKGIGAAVAAFDSNL